MKTKLLTVLLMTLTAVCSAQAQSFDLGTDPGKITYQDAGFTAYIPGNNSTITNVENATRFSSSANYRNLGIMQTFDGLGGGAKNNFSINTQIYLDNYANFRPDLRHGSIHMFAPGTTYSFSGDGLGATLGSTSANGGYLAITTGVSGSSFASIDWAAAGNTTPIARFDTFELTVVVTFSGVDDMLVFATLTRTAGAEGVGEFATVSHLFNNASDYIDGEYFGFGFRGGNSTRTDLNSFALIPIAQTLPFSDDFEKYDVGQAMENLGVFGWETTNSSVVVSDTAFSGDRSVMLPDEETQLALLIDDAEDTRIWTDFYLRPALGVKPSSIPEDVQVHFYFDSAGYINYLDTTTETWTRATNDVFGSPATPADSDSWHRVSVFQNYELGTYALLLDGVVIAQDVPFDGPAYRSFKVTNADNAAYMDDIYVITSPPSDLTANNNHDPDADADELHTHGYVARALVVDDDFTDPAPPYFDEISDALAVWRARDILQVNDGEYGPITVSNSVTLVGEGFTVDSITVESGATLTLEEEVDVAGMLTVESGGSLVLGANANVENLTVAGTVDVGSHTLTVSDTVDLTGTGQILIASGGALDANAVNMDNDTQIVSTGGTFDHSLLTLTGTFTITGSDWNAVDTIAQTLPFSDDFEKYGVGQAMENLGIFGWETTNSSVVVSDTVFSSGNRSVMLPDEETQLALLIDDAQDTRIWTDLYLRPALGVKPSSIPEDVQVHFYFDSAGYINYLDTTTETWTRATNDVFGSPANPADSDSWHRVSVFQNYELGTYALLLDGVVIAQDVPFDGPAYRSFKVTNADNAAYLDDIHVITSRPSDLTANNNHDPDADADELHTHGYVARTLVVDDDFTDPAPPHFDEISDALAVWRERDILQVHAGSYGPITVSNSVTLVGEGFTVDSITVESGATLTLQENVVVAGVIMVESNASLIASGTLDANNLVVVGDLSVDGLLTVADTLTVPAGAMLTLGGDAQAENLTVAGTVDVGSHTLTVTGTANLTEPGQILIASGGTLDANTVNMAHDTQIVSTGGTFDHSLLTLTGTFTITGSDWNAQDTIAQTIPFSDDFEKYEVGQAMENLGIFGWETESSNVTVSSTAASGNRSVMLPDGTELELHIERGGAPRVWTDFYLQPAFGVHRMDPVQASAGKGFSSFVDKNGDLNVAHFDGTSTNWVALNATASWHNNGVVYTNSLEGAFSTNSFTRVSIYQNYENQTFSVIINDENIVAMAMPFPDPSATYQELHIDNTGAVAYFDDILVTPNLLSFPGTIDINDNGMDDREEIHWYGNLESYAGVRGSVFRFR